MAFSIKIQGWIPYSMADVVCFIALGNNGKCVVGYEQSGENWLCKECTGLSHELRIQETSCVTVFYLTI